MSYSGCTLPCTGGGLEDEVVEDENLLSLFLFIWLGNDLNHVLDETTMATSLPFQNLRFHDP